MPDSSSINSKIEATKQSVTSLLQQVEKAKDEKKDQTMVQVLNEKGVTPAALRAPPATRVRRTLKGHFGKVTALQWGGDSQHLVSASQDGNLLIWNAVTANKLQSVPLKSSYVMSVGMEQTNGNLVASGGLDNLCTVYNLSNPAMTTELSSHEGFLSCCRFLNEQEILTSSGDSTCILWDITKAKPISTFAEHVADVMFLSLRPGDKSTFVSCSVDKTAKVWDLRTPSSSVQTFSGHLGDINGVEFMPSDANCFATCSQDNTVRVFDLRAYNELVRFGTAVPPNEVVAGVENDGYTSLAVSRSGRLVFCGYSDGRVYAFDVLLSDEGNPAFVLSGAHERHVSSVGVSPKGNALCTGSWDGVLKIWA